MAEGDTYILLCHGLVAITGTVCGARHKPQLLLHTHHLLSEPLDLLCIVRRDTTMTRLARTSLWATLL